MMFHLDLKLLRSFAAVASTGSVTRAAEKLHLTQPTVSGQIKELELTLGFAVFRRTTRRVDLTDDGRRLLPAVEAVLRQAELLRGEVEDMQRDKALRFRLGAAMYSLDFEDRLSLLEAFGTALPEIAYLIDNRLQCALVADLLDDRLDAAILLGVAAPMPAREHPDSDAEANPIVNEVVYPDSLDRVVIGRRPLGLLVPAESPLARHRLIPKSALAGERVATLGVEHGDAVVGPLVDFLREGGAVPVVLAESNALAIARHVTHHRLAGIGTAWFPVPASMCWRELEGLDLALELAVVLGRSPNRAARRFFTFAKAWQAAREGASAWPHSSEPPMNLPETTIGSVNLRPA